MTKTFAVSLLISNFGYSESRAREEVEELGPKKAVERASVKANVKPFVKWVGGKRQLLKQYKELGILPPKEFDENKGAYFEPFVGGGAIFFDIRPKRAVLTDMNEELVVTYQVIRDDVKSLIKKLCVHQKNNSKEYFLKIRSQKTARLSDVSRAARFIYLNKTAFNGLYRVNKSGQFNVPFGKYKNPKIVDYENLKAVSASLKSVEIKNADYKDVLTKAKKGDFIYFDPPYYPVSRTSNFTSYTKDSFLEKEQIELRNTFLELAERGCFVMLSNSDTTFVRQLFAGLSDIVNIRTVSAGRAINSNGKKRGKVSEVVITNY